MTQEQGTRSNVMHLLTADLTRTACGLPAQPSMNTTTIADGATCPECKMRSGR